MVTRCRQCNKPIALNKTAYTCGPMFCSHKCGVNWAKTLYKSDEYKDAADLRRKATAYFNDVAEEISREDYGARTEYYTVYSEEDDITTVFEQVYEGDTCICQTCIGWHFGKHTDEPIEAIIEAGMTVVFVD